MRTAAGSVTIAAGCILFSLVSSGPITAAGVEPSMVPFGYLAGCMAPAAPSAPSGRQWRSLPLITDGKIDAAWVQVAWGSFIVDGAGDKTQIRPQD